MSFRIKLPPKPHEPDYPSGLLPGRRKKRPLIVNSSEGDDYADLGHSSDPNSDPESEEIANEPDSRFLHQSSSRTTPLDTRPKRPKRKATPDGAPPPKRKRAVSEPHTDDEYAIDTAVAGMDMDGDEDFEAEQHKRQSKKARTKAPGKPMKDKGTVSISESAGRKASSTKANAESLEPRPIVGPKRSRVTPRLEDAGDVASSPDISVTRSPSPPRESPPPPVAKKRKLPTIKKNRTAGVTGTPNKAVPLSGPPKQGLQEGGKTAPVRKTPATAGNADFDLRNESVYRELFKPVSAIYGRQTRH